MLILVTDDITLEDTLEAKVGKTYTINGETYTLADVYLEGGGSVEINANLENDKRSDALHVTDTTVTVNGDVTSTNDDAVSADGKANVTVNGNVKGEYGVYAQDESKVTVNGNVSSSSQTSDNNYGYAETGAAIDAGDKSTVNVNGDVVAGDATTTGDRADTYAGDGVVAYDEATVNVTGNVVGGNATATGDDAYVYGGDGVEVWDKATVNVTGNVTGGSAEATGDYSDVNAGDGVYVENEAIVNITGNVTGGSAEATGKFSGAFAGDGVDAYGETTVNATGNVGGGSAEATGKSSGAFAGDGVEMDATANVTINGNSTGGSAKGDGQAIAGQGATIYLLFKEGEILKADGDTPDEETQLTAGSLYIDGIVKGGLAEVLSEDGYAFDGSALRYVVEGEFEVESLLDFVLSPAIQIEVDEEAGEKEQVYEAIGELLGHVSKHLYISSDFAHYVAQETGDTTFDPEVFAGELLEKWVEKILELHPELDLDAELPINELFAKLAKACQTLTPEQIQELADIYNELGAEALKPIGDVYVEGMLEELLAPEVTVFALAKASDSEVWSSDMGQLVADVLGEEVNYIIHILPSENGSVTTSVKTAKAGETFTITPTPKEGYEVSKVYVSGQEIAAVNGVYSFVVPVYGNVEVSATFAPIASPEPTPEPGDDTPKTGDENSIWLWVGLLAAAAAVMTVVLIKRRHASEK